MTRGTIEARAGARPARAADAPGGAPGPAARRLATPACSDHPGSLIRRYRTRGPNGPGIYLQCVPRDGRQPHLVGWPELRAPDGQGGLSHAELEVLLDAAEGLTMTETAARRGRRTQTIKTQRASMLRKLHARNVPHAVALGMRTGLIALPALAGARSQTD
jgi:DNA-binding CsgD family transcriptional regulator